MRRKPVIGLLGLLLVGNPMADSISADSISYTGIEISTLERRFALFLADFCMRISAVFLFPAEVLVKDSESQTPVSYSLLIVTMSSIWFSFRDMGTGQDRRQTPDKQLRCLKVSHLSLRRDT